MIREAVWKVWYGADITEDMLENYCWYCMANILEEKFNLAVSLFRTILADANNVLIKLYIYNIIIDYIIF